MSRSQRSAHLLVLTATLWLLVVPAANAYIDGASATAVFQGVVAALAAGGMFFKLYWRRVRGWFGRGDEDGPGRDTAIASDDDRVATADVDAVGAVGGTAEDSPTERR